MVKSRYRPEKIMQKSVNVIHISPTDISQWKNESGGAFLDPMIDAAQTTK